MLTSSSQTKNQGPYTPLLASAQGLRDRGVFIYAFAIGDKVKVSELMDLTSHYRNVFSADDFSSLQSKFKMLTEVVKNETKANSQGRLQLSLNAFKGLKDG